MIPVPDFSDESDDFSDTCNTVDIPDQISDHGIYSTTFSAKIPKVHESFNPFELFSLEQSCDPNTSFSETTTTGIDYDIDHPIYKTQSCTLYIGRCDNKYYALKTSQSSNILNREWKNYSAIGKFPTIINAINLIKETDHNLLCSKANYYLQLEYAFGGSIANFIQFINHREAWRILAHISSALDHIHKSGFIHLDISPSNILQCYYNKSIEISQNTENDFDKDEEIVIEKNSLYKLADFGTVIKEGCYGNFCEGAGPYVSPEALKWPNSEFPVTSKTDIWSLGAVMFEIVTHKKMPRDSKRYDAIRSGTLDLSAIIPEEFDIIKQMLEVDPSMRPSAEQLMQLPKVKDILQSLEEDLAFDSANDEIINGVIKENSQQNVSKMAWGQTFPNKRPRRQSFDLI